MQHIPIDDIIVGDRRRQDMGDIQGLAESIAQFGLLHPIVIDDKKRLVAGGRRLEACKSLGWQRVPVRLIGELTDKDLRAIELEENLRRKDLTEIEKSRNMVELAEIKAEEIKREALSAPSDERAREFSAPSAKNRSPGDQFPTEEEFHTPRVQNLGGRPEKEEIKNEENEFRSPSERNIGRPEKSANVKRLAAAIGVSTGTLSEARQHVAAVDKYPQLEELPKKEAIKAAKELDKLPEEEKAQSPYAKEMERINREYRLRSKLSNLFQSTMFFSDDAIPETVRVFMEQFNEPDRADQLIAKLDICINILQKMRSEALKYKKLRAVK